MRRPWPTSRRMDQAHFGPFILRSCLHGAFIWLQVAVRLAAPFLNNFSKQDVTAQGNFVISTKFFNDWPGIKCLDKAEKHYK